MSVDMEKVKDKIEKLLNLSMSDNEHEAALALERALKLMNEHNLSQDDVYKQSMISKTLYLDNRYVLHDWIIKLGGHISQISGCYMVYSQGSKKNNTFAKFILAGREADVLNSEYLITFLIRTIETKSLKYKLVIRKKLGSNTQNKNHVELNSYRLGLIQAIVSRIRNQRKQFFTEQTGNALIPMDDLTRLKEAEDYFKMINQSTVEIKKLDLSVAKEYYDMGRQHAEEISLSVGVDAGSYEEQKLLGA